MRFKTIGLMLMLNAYLWYIKTFYDNMRYIPAIFLIVILISGPSALIFPHSMNAFAESKVIPDYVRNTMQWYLDGVVSEKEMIAALQFLIDKKIIIISATEKSSDTGSDIIDTITVDDADFFTKAKDGITKAIDRIRADETSNLIVRSALPVIPVIGDFLLNLYDNSSKTPQNNSQILAVLEKYDAMNEDSLKKAAKGLQENKDLIQKNQYSLDHLLSDTSKLLEGQTIIIQKLSEHDKTLAEIKQLLLEKNIPAQADRKNKLQLSDDFKNQLAQKENEIKELRSEISQLTDEEPEVDVELLLQLGTADVYSEEYEDAIEKFDKVLDEEPTNLYALNEKAWTLSDLERYSEAIIWFDKVLDVEPKDDYALEGKGWALLDLGQYNDAIIWFDKAIDENPENVDAHEGKGWALLDSGDAAGAQIWCQKALDIDPDFGAQECLDVAEMEL